MLEQIKAAHSKVKTGADFPAYIQDLIALGVKTYDTYVADGHTDYYGSNVYPVSSEPKYDPLIISVNTNPGQFRARLKAHQQGQTSYPTFCNDCAENGIERWTVLMDKMTCTYYDKAGNEVLTEQIPG